MALGALDAMRFTPLLATLALAAPISTPFVLAQDAPSLIPNGNFEAVNDNGDPVGWGSAKGTVSFETENGNRFLRIKAAGDDKMALQYRLISIPKTAKALELSWKQRISELKVGKQAWFDARIMMDFKDAAGSKLKGGPGAPYARKDTDGWVDKNIKFLVPEGAVSLEFMPALFQTPSGIFDLDDIVLKPIEPGPLEEDRKVRAAAAAEKAAKDAEKRDASLLKKIGADGNMMQNGDMQAEGKNGAPEGWGGAKEGSISYPTEDGNRFLRITAPEPFKMVLNYRPVMLPTTAKAIEITWKQRITDIKAGKENFHDARIMTDFIDARFNKVKGGPVLGSAKKATDGWVEKSKSVLVPEGAAGIALMPALFMVEKGTFDLDDFVIKATDPAALIEAAAAAEAERKLINIPYESPQPEKFPLPLHVEGTKILNSKGQEVWLKGVNVMSLDWNPQGERVLLTTKVAIEEWKSNIIRLPIKDYYWFGTKGGAKDGGKAYRELVDAVVNMCANRGVYVLLDLHHYRAARKEHADFWTDAATRYKNHPALIFDVLNEAYGTSWEVWRNGGFVAEKKDGVDEAAFLTEEEKIKNNVGFRSIGMQGLVDAVRATGAKNIIVAGGLDYGYDLSGITKGFALDDKGGNGIVYGSHIYPWKHGWQKDFLDAAAKYPILSGENGANLKKMSFIPAAQQEDAETWVPAFLGLLEQRKIHYTAFSFHPSASPVIISDWKYTPTPEWGSFVKRALAGEKFPPPDKLR